uniref:Uncharacterized protein n=1 Tax=Bosea sp. NBC_00436 TaxID=2969620 RepID=A0A9E8CPK0_9HYPH
MAVAHFKPMPDRLPDVQDDAELSINRRNAMSESRWSRQWE